MTELTPLEKAVLAAIGEQLPPDDQAALTEQIARMTVKSRKNTGAGFFTYFSVAGAPERKIMTDPKGCYVEAKIGAVDRALGFILWVRNGCVDYLEGYPMALVSNLGMDLESMPFELVSGPPFGSISV